MLESVLRHLRNWFCRGVFSGHYVITDGKLTLNFLQSGQYFRMVGSVFNDGVHQYSDALKLTDEAFTGEIWALAVPPSLLKLTAEIEAWQAKHAEASVSPYQSESFGGYSYTLKGGEAAAWQSTFAARLNQWRKL